MKCSILLLVAFLFFGCSGIEDEKRNGERIVSISPSVTATVVAIGAAIHP